MHLLDNKLKPKRRFNNEAQTHAYIGEMLRSKNRQVMENMDEQYQRGTGLSESNTNLVLGKTKQVSKKARLTIHKSMEDDEDNLSEAYKRSAGFNKSNVNYPHGKKRKIESSRSIEVIAKKKIKLWEEKDDKLNTQGPNLDLNKSHHNFVLGKRKRINSQSTALYNYCQEPWCSIISLWTTWYIWVSMG